MISLIKRLFEYKKIRFLFVGGINTVIGYGVYALGILSGLHYAGAQIVSTIVGVINSYFWNKYFTFKKKQKSKIEILRFISVYVVSYILNLCLLWVLIDNWYWNEYLAGFTGLLITTLVSYVGHNKFSFKDGMK